MSHSQGRERTTCRCCGRGLDFNRGKYRAGQLRKFCSTACRNLFRSNRKQQELPRESFTDWVKRVGEEAE
jgi:hypothetical protein